MILSQRVSVDYSLVCSFTLDRDEIIQVYTRSNGGLLASTIFVHINVTKSRVILCVMIIEKDGHRGIPASVMHIYDREYSMECQNQAGTLPA